MTITAQPTRNEYTAIAGQTVFNYTFKIFEDTDLNVYQTLAGNTADDTLDLVTGYTVTGVGDEDGGQIILTTPTSSGDLITIVSDIPQSRTTDYQTNGDFLPPVVNDDFDRVVSLVKQAGDLANRGLALEQSQQGTKPLSLESPEALRYVRWKSDESGLENVDLTALPEVGNPNIITFDTVAEMKSSTSLSVDADVLTLGYYTAGDGGGNLYKIVASGTGTADDGYYIDLASHQAQGMFPGGVVYARQFGIGTADDLARFNAIIARINSGEIKDVKINAGSYTTSGTFDEIIAEGWSIKGSMYNATILNMDALAGTTGTFFNIGNVSTRAKYWTIEGLQFTNLNIATLDGTENPIHARNSVEGYLDLIHCFDTAGFITIGDTVNDTSSNRTKVMRCQSTNDSTVGGKVVDIQSSAGHFFAFCNFAATGTADPGFRGLYMHPTVTDVFDTGKFTNCEWNYGSPDPEYTVEVDASAHSIGSQQFLGCVFDQAVGSNFYLHIDAGAPTTSLISITCDGCISNGSTGADAILIDNTGGRKIYLSWKGGLVSQVGNAATCVKITGGNPVDAFFNATEFISRSGGIPETAIEIGDGCGGVTVSNCSAPIKIAQGTGLPYVAFNHLVKFLGSASDCVIKGNRCTELRSDSVNTDALTEQNLETIFIGENTPATYEKLPFNVVTADATPTTLQTVTLEDEHSYILTATVHGQNNLSSKRAFYKFAGIYYRSSGGPATIQGAITDIVDIESTAAWDATFTTSSNDVSLVVTGEASVGIQWRYELEVFKNTQ